MRFPHTSTNHMGTWVTTNTGFRSFLSDRFGYKSGLVLNNAEMIELLGNSNPLIDIFNQGVRDLETIFQHISPLDWTEIKIDLGGFNPAN